MRAELEAVLLAHAARYPRMEPGDGVKLLYQNEFGGGHLVASPEDSLRALRAEYAAVEHDPSLPLAEDIGGGMVRVMLAAAGARSYPLEELNEDFVRSANSRTGSMEAFLEKLEVLRAVTAAGRMPFSPQALEDYLAGYLAAGCPPVSHSPAYRAAYRPAYRVVERRRAVGLLVHRVNTLPAGGRGRVLVALDGRCAAGKTTLARRLGERYGWSVVHMDHFFLRPEQRTPERNQAPGENVDHERFLEQVLLPLERGEEPVYRPFHCHTQRLGEPVRVELAPVVLVEGSYACHPSLREHYDLRVFLTVERQEQLRRIAQRNGLEGLERFRVQWIPLEEGYFSACGVEQGCALTLEL